MEGVRTFLESSTIHGLAYIATSAKYVRLFWTIVVIAGFTCAGILIYESFNAWSENPIKTTIDTLPITKITFPKVTVCPPKNTYTDLNYDLMMTENMTLDNDTRAILTLYAVELLYDHIYENTMKNLSKIEEKDRFYNWYHGYSWIVLTSYYWNALQITLETSATSGTISTEHFGEKFDKDLVEPRVKFDIDVYPPSSIFDNPNVTLHFEVEQVSMSIKDLSTGKDKLTWGYSDVIKAEQDSKNHTPPGYYQKIRLERKVSQEDIMKQELSLMPGFRFTWHYSGTEVELEDLFDNNAFVRKGFISN